MKRTKILVLSWEAWNGTNSFGNSYSSIFKNISQLEIANISCRYGRTDTNIVSRSFQITEKSILKSFISKSAAGHEILDSEFSNDIPLEKNGYNRSLWNLITWVRTHRFTLIFWLRDLIWFTKKWKCKELNRFIDDFDPDVIWIPVYYSTYMNDIALYLKKYTNKPMVSYISDDNYTLNQFSLSPLYWIDRLIKRPYIKKVIKNSKILYVITEKQRDEYKEIFGIECLLLWKGADFTSIVPTVPILNSPLKMVFMGNIGLNRWKSIVNIIDALKIINKDSIKLLLDIYTLSPLTDEIKSKLNIEGVSCLMKNIPSDEINAVFENSDILLHVEPTSLKYRLMYRLSFSTKLVDCFAAARCIFAYGGNTGSLDYLRRNDAGIIVSEKKEIYSTLLDLINDSDRIKSYGIKSFQCGLKNHNLSDIQTNLVQDLKRVINQ